MKIGFFDTEANGLLSDATRLWCAVVVEKGGDRVVFGPNSVDKLTAHLETFDVLIGHNIIMYDFPLLRKLYGWEYKGKKVDTLIMSRTQRPQRALPRGHKGYQPHSIEAWGVRLGHPKVGQEQWEEYDPNMLDRCDQDVRITEQVYNELLREGAGEGWREAHMLNFKLFDYLQRQEEYGWLVDQEHINYCINRLNSWIERIDRSVADYLPIVIEKEGTDVRKPFRKNGSYSKMVVDWLGRCYNTSLGDSSKWNVDNDRLVGGPFTRITFRPVDLDKNVELKNTLLRMGWKPAEWNTNNAGEPTSPKLTQDDRFEGIQGSLGKLLIRRVKCKQRRGTLEGWQDLIREDGRISARVAGIAATGRIRHAGIVNVPSPHSGAFFAKEMRKTFIASPGWKLVGIDSAGNQMRQLAARMRDAGFPDEEFEHAIIHGRKEDGTDMHSVNQRRSGAPSRSRAKNFFYGLIFGAGDAKIGKVIDGDTTAGKALRDAYFEEMPGIKLTIERATEQFRSTAQKWYNKKYDRMEYKNGWITGLDGRPVLVPSEHMILVYYLQSDEAIQMAAAYVWFHKQMERRGYEWKKDFGVVIWMHDEYQVDCRPEIAEEVAELGKESIAWAGRFYGISVPHEGDAKIGDNWYETH